MSSGIEKLPILTLIKDLFPLEDNLPEVSNYFLGKMRKSMDLLSAEFAQGCI